MFPLSHLTRVIAIATAILAGAKSVDAMAEPLGKLNERSKTLSLTGLERRLATIDERLSVLSSPSMRTGVGAVGYRSNAHIDSVRAEWIQITLAESARIDQVVLVPTIWRDTVKGFRADGFPLEFHVRIGSKDDAAGKRVASFNDEDRLLPRVAPLVISFPACDASWVRVEADRLSPRGWDGLHLLQLSEVFVFSGMENVALHQAVEVSSSDQVDRGLPRYKDYLVDGFVPYLMDAHDGGQSLAFLSRCSDVETPILSIDLQRPQPINRIHLHSPEVSDNVPQALAEDFGIPRSIVVEGANEADFSDSIHLCDYRMTSPYDAGPIIMRRFPKTVCRYVRLVITEPSRIESADQLEARFGFAEIGIYAQGVNVAFGLPVAMNFEPTNNGRPARTLTDGHNLFGRILPIKDWLAELAMRHDLEVERPRITAELRARYQNQRGVIRGLSWLAGILGLLAVCSVFVERGIRHRAVSRTRERIAADLHDELGANLHALGLLGDLAEASSDSPEKLKPLLRRARELTERSGAATRYCANLLESKGLFGDLLGDMRHTSSRLMADLDHELIFEGEEFIQQLKPSIRIDLFLFYKECLTNILRHSHATEVTTRLHVDRKSLVLTISDNGCGLDDSQISRIPGSLSRRAKLAGAKVTADRLADGGTSIALSLHTKRFGWI